jgi:hypothetical protein
LLIARGVGAMSVAQRAASAIFVLARAEPPGVEWVGVGAVSIPMGSPLPL